MKIDKKNGKGFSSFLGALVAFIFIIVAFNTIITSFFKKDVKTETPVEEVFYNSVVMNAALIKTEEVYQAGRNSYFTTQAKEGEKVKKGLENLSVTKSANDVIDKKLAAINKRLKDLDYDTSDDIGLDNKVMTSKIKALQISINQKRYEDLSQILNSTEDDEDKYYESIKNYSIDKLLEMKDELLINKRSDAPSIRVSMSGIVSYFIDGLEDNYTNKNFDAIFEKDLL